MCFVLFLQRKGSARCWLIEMPSKGLEEEGLPKIPDLQLVQLKFLLTVDDSLGVDKAEVWTKLEKAITENGMLP